MVVWAVITFGFDHRVYFIIEELCSKEETAKVKASKPSMVNDDIPHRNMRGYLKMEVDKPAEYSWSDIQVTDKERLRRIEKIIGGDVDV